MSLWVQAHCPEERSSSMPFEKLFGRLIQRHLRISGRPDFVTVDSAGRVRFDVAGYGREKAGAGDR